MRFLSTLPSLQLLQCCWAEVVFKIMLFYDPTQAHKLEMREEEMKKRDTLYKEHIAKLESKCSQFYKVTSDSFQKSKEETLNRFARFNIQPVCGDLQSQILKCYQENPGKTLSCSGIASAYMQCVNKAKMVTRGKGGCGIYIS
uniref:Coiled-coil-helix-coiled-coil-helix domain containing 3b n=1 Tax=Periophthalmus magnuspinnatus TaxID=409849 RepID=A0A3B3ZQN3_9GOBI